MASYWIHETAVVIGDVILGDDVSVWPTAVIRGDVEQITIGARSNVQDGAVIHADEDVPTVIGEDCVIGHRAIVHGTVLENGVLVGMGAILLNGTHVGEGAIIAAGAVVKEGTVIPAGALVAGVPAKIRRITEGDERLAQCARILNNAARYAQMKEFYRNGDDRLTRIETPSKSRA